MLVLPRSPRDSDDGKQTWVIVEHMELQPRQEKVILHDVFNGVLDVCLVWYFNGNIFFNDGRKKATNNLDRADWN